MELNNNKLALIILIFIVLSVSGNLFVWLKVTGNLPVGWVTFARVSVCIDRPPTLESIQNQSATARQNFTYQVNATDSSTPIYYYNITPSNLTSFSMNHTSGLINFTLTDAEVGNHTIYIWVTHDVCGNNSNASATFTLSVLTANTIPYWINYTRNLNITEDIPFTLNLSTFVLEPDNETFNMTHNSTPQIFPSFNMSLTGLINFSANDSDVGLHKMNITVTDVRNGKNSSIFNFSVINVNDAPLLQTIPDREACEDVNFNYTANATDQDLLIPAAYRIEVLHYYDNTSLFVINENTGLISFTPTYLQKGLHNMRIYVSDEEAADYKDFKLDIIEVNDAPVMSAIGAQTIYVNESINLSVTASDEESGNSPNNNLTFNLTFLNGTKFFNINRTTGLINFTANSSVVGTYSIMVWVNDTALASSHVNATSTCNDGTNKSDYEIFSLTITSENRAPTITYYNPTDRNLTIYEAESITFSVGAYDADGTTTTVNWYSNGTVVRTNNSLNDTYIFTTDYTSAGRYNITANVSDGLAQDSEAWNATVLDATPPTPQDITGGGGGGGGACIELWACSDWNVCQNASAPEFRFLLGNLYDKILLDCSKEGIATGSCGYQIRSCTDKAKCTTSLNKPSELKICTFTISPDCYDDILNCHNGLCEVLVDCGGPCVACPTCSDGIQNQNEEWIDCGGPCPPCPIEFPKPPKCGDKKCEMPELFTCRTDCGFAQYTIIIMILLVAMLVIIVRRQISVAKIKEREKELRRKRAYLYNLIALAEKAIKENNEALARHYYSQARKLYNTLPAGEKKKSYNKIIKLFSDIGKLK